MMHNNTFAATPNHCQICWSEKEITEESVEMRAEKMEEEEEEEE